MFNLVDGLGSTVGAAIAGHKDVDMVSFTGSTGSGIKVAKAAADTVKRVSQELGGKSANILFDDVDMQSAVSGGIQACFMNSGQNCTAPSRMLVPKAKMAEAAEIAKAVVDAMVVGDPVSEETTVGPVVSDTQYGRIQALIESGVEEGATVVCGGPGKPPGTVHGYFVKPTIFADVRNDMRIAKEEIFGPVLCIIGYEDDEDAVRIANETPYGLAAYIQSADTARAESVCARMRAGMVFINGAPPDFSAPFGGYKQSGNGREWGLSGVEDFLETKAVMGL